jgi:putative ABC transport system permease protein
MNRDRLLLNLSIAFEAVTGNALRSILTALGIIFGVAAVVAMMAIGQGAKKEILDQLEMVGVNNIEINAITEEGEESALATGQADEEGTGTAAATKRFSPGLSLLDMDAIGHTLAQAKNLCPEATSKGSSVYRDSRLPVSLLGTTPEYFQMFHFQVVDGGLFTAEHVTRASPVCVLGKNVMVKLFRGDNPIGKFIKIDNQWVMVLGVVEKPGLATGAATAGIRDFNNTVYIPIATYLGRLKKRENGSKNGVTIVGMGRVFTSESNETPVNPHELDRITVQMETPELLEPAKQMLDNMLLRRHNQVKDFEISIPELLLKQQQRSKDIFNYVLLSIAFISLLVGGIGIMNIMLASVYERIKEIGIRMSMGATKTDIVTQFVLEAVVISLTGGVIGVFVGIGLSLAITIFTDIQTIISWWAVAASFVVAAGVGLLFGIMPARKAAKQDPITSLRHE